MEVTINRQLHAFASTFYFFADTQGNAKKIKRACKQQHHDSAAVQDKFGQTLLRTDRRASANSGFNKLAVQWLNEHTFYASNAVLVKSFVLQNRQLLKPVKR